MKNKICLIYNYAQHYRLGIFKLLNDRMNVDFYFGDSMSDVKKLDYNELSNFKIELRNIKLFSNFYWQKGGISVFFKNYDQYIILGEYYCLSTWIILLLAKFTNKKIHLWSHGWYGKESFFQKVIKKIFFSLADNTFLYGNHAKKLMVKEGIDENKLHVIYNSLDYNNQITNRYEINHGNFYKDKFQNSDPVLIFIGRLTKIKKLHYIIEAINNLKQKRDLNLVIIGDGEEKDELEILVHNYNLNDRVWFVGALYDELEIAKYIYYADLCVSPGNVGLTAMHSLVYGTPVITNNDFSTQMPEFESILEGVSGDFFKKDDINDLTNIINEWFEIGLDRDSIRDNCFKIIDTYFNPEYQYSVINKVIMLNY